MTVYVSGDQLIALNRTFGGAVLNKTAVFAAADRPSAGFANHEEYPGLVTKAAILLHGIASTQNFSDGNKRTAWVAMRFFLEVNGISLRQPSRIASEAFVLTVATGLFKVEQIEEWIAQHIPSGRVEMLGGTIGLAALIGPGGWIENLEATGVTFTGPGVLVFAEHIDINGGSINVGGGTVESVWWEIDPVRNGVVGAIGARNCKFNSCNFVGIGIAGPPDFAPKFFSAMQIVTA